MTTQLGTNRKLQQLLTAIVNAMRETIQSIVDRELSVRAGRFDLVEPAHFGRSLTEFTAVVRGTLDKDFAGKTLRIAIPLKDAVTLAGLMMLTAEDVIEENRASETLEGEDLEAFTEVGNMLCSAIDGALRQAISRPIGARVQDAVLFAPGNDKEGLLGAEPAIVLPFQVKIGAYPETTFHLLIDRETAERWNGGSLEMDESGQPTGDEDPSDAAVKQRLLPGDVPFDEIPEGEIRGKLAAYLHQPELYDVVRRSCRRVGLEVERHGRTAIPNPAAHKDQIVVMDVPPGEDRRFSWASRLKGYEANTAVVLIVQHPSKSRVLQGFLAKADAIVGWPLPEIVLSNKLTELLDQLLGDDDDE